MAKLAPGIEFTGSLGNFTAYRRQDMDRVIFRTKGGPSKETIATALSCAPVRRNNCEFAGVSKAASLVYNVLHPLLIIRDYPLKGELQTQLQLIKEMDKTAAHGKRGVYLSKAPGILSGLPLNRRNPFESVVRNPLTYSISKDDLLASVETPAVRPDINFFPIGNLPVYRWIISFGLIPDMVFNKSKGYLSTGGQKRMAPCVVDSPWFPVAEKATPLAFELSIPFFPVDTFSLMLAAAISFGRIESGGQIVPVKYCGAGKVIAMR